LAFGCRLFGGVDALGRSRVVGLTPPEALQNLSAPSANSGRTSSRRRFQTEQQFAPIPRNFARTVSKADERCGPLASRRSAPERTASRLQAGPADSTVGPDARVAFRRSIALLPHVVLVDPSILEANNGGWRQPDASLPSNAAGAPEKSPVEMHFK
jgi:hypothetical protein